MSEIEDKIKEAFENWVGWKLYKVLYIGILVPLLLQESRKWLFQDFVISLVFFITVIILLLPILFKILNLVNLIEEM